MPASLRARDDVDIQPDRRQTPEQPRDGKLPDMSREQA
jgi:hypothetical protein